MRSAQSFPTPMKKVRRNKAWTRLLWTVIVLIILFIGLGLLSHLSKVVIGEVEISGTKVLHKEEVSAEVKEYLEGNVALLFARGNIFLYSKNKLSEFILNEFPRVYGVVEITRNVRVLEIKLEERQAAFTWCGDEAPLYNERFEKRNCYFLDQTGFVFDESPYFTPGVYLAFYGGLKPDIDPVGQTLAIKNSVMSFDHMAEVLDQLKLPTHSVVITTDNQNEFLLDIFTNIGDYPKILFSEDMELVDIEAKINSIFSEESFLEQFEDNSSGLEYIDTRFSNRVFYKFRD